MISGKGIDPYGTTTGWIATVSPLPLCTFLGFDRPLENWPFSNSVKAGSTVPIKWQLKDGNGAFISDLSTMKTVQFSPVACDSLDMDYNNPIAAIASGASGLQYDNVTHEFTFAWKTAKSSSYTCVLLVLSLSDGQKHFARFALK